MAEEAEDEPDDDEESGEEEGGKKGGKKKLILIIAISVFVLTGGFLGAYLFGALDFLFGETVEEPVKIVLLPPIYHEFPEIMVDLKSTSRRTRYIKVKAIAEVSGTHAARIKELDPKIKDGFQTWLRQQTRKDLTGTAGTEKMRAAFLQVVNEALAPDVAESVLFKEILLQ